MEPWNESVTFDQGNDHSCQLCELGMHGGNESSERDLKRTQRGCMGLKWKGFSITDIGINS